MSEHGKYEKLVSAATACVVGWPEGDAPTWAINLAEGLRAAGCPIDENDHMMHAFRQQRLLTVRVERLELERLRLQPWATLVSDLDRNEHGRHEGDVDAGDHTGVSQGNPVHPTGSLLGYTLNGDRIIMPPKEKRSDPDAWKEPRA